MPNRIIKESICYSEDIDRLSAFEETVFYRLIVNVDDFGRIDARPAFLRSRLFVTKQGITEKNIIDAVNKLVSVGLVKLYEVDKKSFLLFPKWGLHQRIRNSKEKYPAPQEADLCGNSPQLAATCGNSPPESNPIRIQSESESESKTRAQARFGEFWSNYPRKVGKIAAEKAFMKISPDTELFNRMLLAIKEQSNSATWKKDNGQYIPNPATWLNQGRWDDEVDQRTESEAESKNGGSSFQLDEFFNNAVSRTRGKIDKSDT